MPNVLLALMVTLQSASLAARESVADGGHPGGRRPRTGERRLGDDTGQATTEYALVLVAAALVALLVVAWATAGGGAAKIASLFDAVIDKVIGEV